MTHQGMDAPARFGVHKKGLPVRNWKAFLAEAGLFSRRL